MSATLRVCIRAGTDGGWRAAPEEGPLDAGHLVRGRGAAVRRSAVRGMRHEPEFSAQWTPYAVSNSPLGEAPGRRFLCAPG
eukprot:scaffold56335_cov19-Tisochrysis_lutea.AAC.1